MWYKSIAVFNRTNPQTSSFEAGCRREDVRYSDSKDQLEILFRNQVINDEPTLIEGTLSISINGPFNTELEAQNNKF